MARAFALPRPLAGGGLVLWACCALHLVNDAMFSLLFPLLPMIAGDLHLSLAEAGLVKTAFSTASSVFQVPVGVLAERWGAYLLLVGGNAWVAVGLIGMGLAGAFVPLLALSVLAGLGGNSQHPLAMSLVTRWAPDQRRATMVGTLNFSGDLGKICAPLLVILVAVPFGWPAAMVGLGVFAVIFSAAIARLPVEGQAGTRRETAGVGHSDQKIVAERGWALASPRRFAVLGALGMIDGSTRAGALAFLPFLLVDRGLETSAVGVLFSVLFVGGAVGKFVCGPLADRFGSVAAVVVTELVTCGALLLLPVAPLLAIPLIVAAFGVVLNGTSSVLYAAVADFFPASRRSRGYGLYYTLILSSSALAPLLYGLLGDRVGLIVLFVAMAAVNASTVLLAPWIQRSDAV